MTNIKPRRLVCSSYYDSTKKRVIVRHADNDPEMRKNMDELDKRLKIKRRRHGQ
jgi:hypothetical protein